VSLATGTRLGAYEILAPLGAGGMGEVYRARDPKLNRDVAIKILPEALAADPAALARFEREAQAVAALSHPNILAIHDFGRQGEIAYAVMELLEGETLRARLDHGALPARKAAEFATQIAEGLAAAHEKGIVHRDLKPENIFVTHERRAKILDFGVAKRASAAGDSGANVETALAHTGPGTVLGTVGYMSPEQVRGEVVDPRSDIFSFGVVLYEMLTGQRAFQGATPADTMSAILKEDPPELATAASGSSPSPALQRIVQHCLEKKPGERFQSARDVAFALQALSGSGVTSGPAVAAARRGARPWFTALAVAAVLGVGGVLGWLATSFVAPRRAAPASPELRPSFRQLTKLPGGEGSPSLSPNSESVVFVKRDDGDLDLFSQRIDGTKAIPLTAECEKDDFAPAFSSDGRWIAYRSECNGGGIFVMGATGESSRRVTDFGFAPAWSPGGGELAVVTERLNTPTNRNSTSELWVVNVDSGVRRRVSAHDAMGPTWSPDGRRVAFWGLRGDGFQRDLWSVAADGSESAPEAAVSILDDPALDWAPVYSRDGHWLYFASTRGGTFNLWRLALDTASGRPRGKPEPLTVPSKWAGPFALSADGRRIVYVTRDEQSAIQRAPFDLARQELAAAPAPVFSGSFELRDQTLSPDGGWILFTNEDLPQHLHLVRPGGAAYRQLTTGGDRNRQGAWSPKGDWIVFQTTRGESSLAAIRPDGGGWQPIPVGPGFSSPYWSPDGSTIAAYATSRGGFLIDVSKGLGAPVMRQLPPVAPGLTFWPIAWSPDSALLAGGAMRAGQTESLVVYSIANGDYREVPWSRGVRTSFYETFVDRQRLLVIATAGELRLGDVRGTESKLLYTAPAGHRIDGLAATRDGRWLTWIDRKDESDIWLMTLDEAGRGSNGDVRR